MAILNFPSSPHNGDQYTGDNGTTYIFDGVKWVGHAISQPAGTNSITNNGHTVQVDGDGNLVIPTGSIIKYEDGAGYGTASTRWDAVPAVAGCPIYTELTPDHFKAYTQQSHLDINNTGGWDLGSNFNGTGLFSNDNNATLYSNRGDVTIRVNDSQTNFTFGQDGYLTMESLHLQGYLKGVDGSTGSTGQVLTRQSNGGAAWAAATGGSSNPNGGVADNSAGITITTYTLQSDLGQYDNSGSVTYHIRDAGATAAGVIFKGLTVSHTQPITGDINQGDNVVSWSTLDYQLWEQVVSVTAYVTDSRGYTFYTVVQDAYDVPHGPCLVEGTQVTMADGTHKAIEDITHGELIRVWNFDLGEFSEAQPIWIKAEEETTGHDVYTFSDGTQLRTVGHHVFNKQAGAFTKLKHAETPVGTTTFNEQGLEVTLISKERVIEPTRYYNVWTQYHLNLFADGILTSNRFNNIYPIVDMKFVKDDRALRSVEEFAGIDEKYITGLRLQEQTYSVEYIQNYVHNRLERTDIANILEQGI